MTEGLNIQWVSAASSGVQGQGAYDHGPERGPGVQAVGPSQVPSGPREHNTLTPSEHYGSCMVT